MSWLFKYREYATLLEFRGLSRFSHVKFSAVSKKLILFQ